MSSLKISLFGPPRVELDDLPVDIKRRKALAMLIYLAVSNQPHSRDALATLFYPDHSQSRARTYLRRDLSVLNTTLAGDWLDTDRDTVELKGDSWVDVIRFHELLAECQQHDHPAEVVCSACVSLLEEAAALYSDDFLTGFTLRDCPEFDDWQFFQTESLRHELATALERLVRGCAQQGAFEAAIPHARRWVALDPLHEPAQRALIQLYDQAEQQAAALRQYEKYVDLLDEELGLPPEEETTTLYEAIKAKRMLGSYLKSEQLRRPREPIQQETGVLIDQEADRRTPHISHAVGREGELEQLHAFLAKALDGDRQLVFVTGETGVGKTTLVEMFLEQATSVQSTLWVGHGQCIEQHGMGEAYLPVLEALGRMCREPGGQPLIRLLAKLAPTWLVQMPWLVSAEELERLQQSVVATTRERMLREMVEAVEVLTAERPLVLVLEDLHWSDYSTLDLVSWLAQRQERARLLLIGTYRPADAKMTDHPLRTVVQEMSIRGQSTELALPLLTEAATEAYLAARFPQSQLPEELAHLLQQRTAGNPLFIRTVVDSWVAEGAVAQVNEHWELQTKPETLAVGVPEQLRPLIEQQLRGLPAEDQQVLEAASVAGMTFSSAAVAAAVGLAEEEIERRCATLARRSYFLRSNGITEWPDGTVATRFGFIHHFYQEVLYDRVTAGRQVRLHRQIGERLEAGYGAHAPERAAELAMHFVRGHEPDRAVEYLRLAAEHALQRSAPREAIEHLTQGLELVGQHPELPDCAKYELTLWAELGPALIATKGWSVPEAEEAYVRARELAHGLGDARQLSQILYGLATLHEMRGEYTKSQALLEERLQLLRDPQNRDSLLESHELLACSTFHQGDFSQALDHADQGTDLYDPRHHLELIVFLAENPGVSCHHWAGLTLWCLGYPDRALDRIRLSLDLAHDLAHSFSLAQANQRAAMLHQFRREERSVQERAERAIAVAAERGFLYWSGTGDILRGWALAVQGQHEEGIAQLRRGIETCQSTGATIDQPYFLALLAEAYGHAGRVTEGLETLTEALALVRRSRAFFFEPELYRLKGELLLQANSAGSGVEAEASFERALELARSWQGKSLELRAAVSLGRLWQDQGKIEEARHLLSDVYGWFTEGFETFDLQEAKGLLEELGDDV